MAPPLAMGRHQYFPGSSSGSNVQPRQRTTALGDGVQPHPVTPHPFLPSPAGEKLSCLPEEKQKRPLGIEVTDVIFLVCSVSFSFYKINTTKVLEEWGETTRAAVLHQYWLSSLASHADLMLLFLPGLFSPPQG